MEKRFEESPQSVIYSKILKHFLERFKKIEIQNKNGFLSVITTQMIQMKHVSFYLESTQRIEMFEGFNHNCVLLNNFLNYFQSKLCEKCERLH